MKLENINDIIKNLNNMQMYHYNKTGTISSGNTTTSLTFKTDNMDLWCIMPYVALTNANGQAIDESAIDRNLIKMNIKVLNGNNLFGDYNFTLESFNEMYLSEQFQGFLVEGNSTYEITFTGLNIPASTNVDMPYSVSFNFVGYQLGFPANAGWNAQRQKLDFRYGQIRQYSITAKSGNSTADQNTIRTTLQGQIIDTMRVDVIDANGKVITEKDIQDEFVINFKYNQNQIMFNNMPLRVFNKITRSKRFRRLYLDANTDYTIDVLGTSNTNYSAQRLAFDAMTADFVVGDTITGGTSSATGVIVEKVGTGATGYFILKSVTGTFQDNETITGAIQGSATADGTLSTSLNVYPLTFNFKFDGYQMGVAPNVR